MSILNFFKKANSPQPNGFGNGFSNQKNTDEERKRKKKRFIYSTILIALVAAVLIIILCAIFLPKTKDLIVLSLSSNYAGKNLIYMNTNVGVVYFNVINLAGCKISVLSLTSTDTIYSVYIPHSSIGPIQFQYEVFNYPVKNGIMQYIRIGQTVFYINLTNNLPTNSTPLLTNESYFFNAIYLNSALMNYPTHQIPWALIVQVIFLVIFILLMFGSFYSLMKGGLGAAAGNDLFSIGKSLANIVKPTTKFKDVGGIQEEKYELQEIVDFLKNPFKYTRVGARVPKGVILYGPPGTGKTLLAKAVAGEANAPFYETSGSTFEDMLVGVGAKRIRELFNKARKTAPSIIFIDEIDAVASRRSQNKFTSNDLSNQTLNQLLAEMDGFNNEAGIVVIAATNRLDFLDEAILRPGRFDRQIQVNLPDIDERVQILKIHARNKRFDPSISFEDIARRTPGFSGAQLENALNEAALMSVRAKHTWITMQDVDEGIDRVVGGPAKHTKKVVFEEKKQIAFHEAGHALVGLMVPGSEIVEKITIIPRGKAAGYTVKTPANQELSIQKKSDLLGYLATALGGRASEEVIYGPLGISTGASDDLNKATKLAKAMVTQFGMTDLGLAQYDADGSTNPYFQQYSENIAQKIDAKVNEILNERYLFAKTLVQENQRELELIVESLLILETIDRKQIEYIHQEKKLPKAVVKKIYFLIDTNQLDEQYLFAVEKNQFLKNINNPYPKEEYTTSVDKNN